MVSERCHSKRAYGHAGGVAHDDVRNDRGRRCAWSRRLLGGGARLGLQTRREHDPRAGPSRPPHVTHGQGFDPAPIRPACLPRERIGPDLELDGLRQHSGSCFALATLDVPRRVC